MNLRWRRNTLRVQGKDPDESNGGIDKNDLCYALDMFE